MNDGIVVCPKCNIPVQYDRMIVTPTSTTGVYKCPSCGYEYRQG